MEKDNIELPPLPDSPDDNGRYGHGDMKRYAHAAIKTDRQQRGEPVAYAVFADNGNIRIWSREPLDEPGAVPLYARPQPAATAQDSWQQLAAHLYQAAGAFNMPVRFLDILSTAANGEPFDHMLDRLLPVTEDEGGVWDSEATPQPVTPEQEPSDEDIERLAAEHLSAHAQFVDAGEVHYEGEIEFARALLARYGNHHVEQSGVPEGWRLVPVEPTSKQIVMMACQIKGADADGWYRTVGADWPDHVSAAERAYKCAIEDAPNYEDKS